MSTEETTRVAVVYVEDWVTPPKTALVNMNKEEVAYFKYVNGKPRGCFHPDNDLACDVYNDINKRFEVRRAGHLHHPNDLTGSWRGKEVRLNDKDSYDMVMVFVWPT